MLNDHDPVTLREFRGIFDRSENDITPAGYFLSAQNNRYISGGVKTREGTTLLHTLGSVVRMALYKRTGEATRLLLLDNTGKLYDSTNLAAPILNIAAMTDFSMVTMFNRAYITPHNGVRGLPGEKIYLYEGSGVARAAGGTAPTGFTLGVAESALSGNVEAGLRLFGVAYESSSGFISSIGPAVLTSFTSAGGKKLDFSAIPVGPAGTIARRLVATKRIIGYDGNQDAQTFYSVPGGRINDNVSVVLISVDFFDADLVEDVTYLFDQLAEIPAGLGIGQYDSSLIVFGEDANPSIVRISKGGEPESHDAVEGYLTVNPGDSGGAVNNYTVYRSQLLLMKSQRTYGTQRKAGLNAAFWDAPSIDDSVGTECHGVGKILDLTGSAEDKIFVADRAGIRFFIGSFQPQITYNCDGTWDRINKAAFNTIEVAVDPVEALIFAAVPLDGATSPSHLLVGDYVEGLEQDAIRWDLWKFPWKSSTIVIDVDTTTKETVLYVGSRDGNVYKLNEAVFADNGTAIDAWIETYVVKPTDDEVVNHFGGVRLRAKGNGNLAITASGEDHSNPQGPYNKVLAASPGIPVWQPLNFVSEGMSVKLRVSLFNERYTITKIVLYAKILWVNRPQ